MERKPATITITKEELITAQASALMTMTIKSPAIFIIQDELLKLAALTAKILFHEEEK